MSNTISRIQSDQRTLSEVIEINRILDPQPAPPKRGRGRPRKDSLQPHKPKPKKGELPESLKAALRCTSAEIPELFDDVTRNILKGSRQTPQVTDAEKNQLRRHVLDAVRLGKDYASIRDEIVSYGYSRAVAGRYLNMVKEQLEKEYHCYVQSVARTNTIAIQGLLQRAVDSNDTKTALECIRELNKMTGVYAENSLTVKSEGPVTISFGGEPLSSPADPDSDSDYPDAGVKIIESE